MTVLIKDRKTQCAVWTRVERDSRHQTHEPTTWHEWRDGAPRSSLDLARQRVPGSCLSSNAAAVLLPVCVSVADGRHTLLFARCCFVVLVFFRLFWAASNKSPRHSACLYIFLIFRFSFTIPLSLHLSLSLPPDLSLSFFYLPYRPLSAPAGGESYI